MWFPGVAFFLFKGELPLTKRWFGSLACPGNDIVLFVSQTSGSSSCIKSNVLSCLSQFFTGDCFLSLPLLTCVHGCRQGLCKHHIPSDVAGGHFLCSSWQSSSWLSQGDLEQAATTPVTRRLLKVTFFSLLSLVVKSITNYSRKT